MNNKPLGYIIYDKEVLQEIYKTGRGSVKLRAKYQYDKKDNCIEVTEIPRLETENAPISATAVRRAMEQGDHEALKKLVPQTTYDYLCKEAYL